MRYITIFLAVLMSIFCALAQVRITGKVIDGEDNTPLTGASVVIKGSDGKIKKFSTTKTEGDFSIIIPSKEGCTLEVSMMGFGRKVLGLDTLALPATIYLEPGATLLKEVAVTAKKIREQGDTISYNVGGFAQNQDRSLGDVLKRMPGINVEQSGKIQYQGEDINKFYIEGSDVLGGKYGIATKGINHEDVGAVEVMENHQPMQVLSGISFSDQAAINVKLKGKAKAIWSLHGNAGGGYSWQPKGGIWSGEAFAMAVMPKFQNITTFKTNNIGENLMAEATDFFASRRGTELSRYVGVSLPGVPNLSEKRTLFNRSALVSTNGLWKMGNGELKAQVDYAFNRVQAAADNITTYFLEGNGTQNGTVTDRIITENREGTERANSLSGKVIYELNQKTAFVNNTLRTNIDWDNIDLAVSGTLINTQNAKLPDYYVANDFKLIKRFDRKPKDGKGDTKSHLVNFVSKNEWESLPQNLQVISKEGEYTRQHVADHAFFTHESVSYTFVVKGVSIGLEGGVKGYFRSMNSDLAGLDDLSGINGVDELGLTNVVNTNNVTVYASPRVEYWIKKVNLALNAPVNYAHYTFDKALANRNEGYFSPSVNMMWRPNNRLQLGLRGGTGRSPMSLHLIQPGLMMTNYRSFSRGVDDFYNSTSQNLSAHISYKHTQKGLFANAFAMQGWNKNPYTVAQQLFGDYVVNSYTPAKSTGKTLMAMGNFGKTLDFMRGSANINGAFSRNESHLLSESRNVNSVSTAWSVGATLSGTPMNWLSFDYRIKWSSSRLAMNSAKASWLGNMESELLLSMLPSDKWEWHVSGEFFRNELADNLFKNVFLLDTKLIYKLSKRIEISGSLTNILDKRSYDYKTYNTLNSYESHRWLRGREFLISILLRK